MKKLTRLALAALLAGATLLTSAAANAAAVSFQIDASWQPNYGQGAFVGTDTNHDSFLNLGELASFSFVGGFYNLSLADLNSFGSFDLTTGVWNADTPGGGFSSAWFSWNNDQQAVSPDWAVLTITSASGIGVPEPATLALLGVAGLGFLRRRQAA